MPANRSSILTTQHNCGANDRGSTNHKRRLGLTHGNGRPCHGLNPSDCTMHNWRQANNPPLGDLVRGGLVGPGSCRTSLVLHNQPARPSKQPRLLWNRKQTSERLGIHLWRARQAHSGSRHSRPSLHHPPTVAQHHLSTAASAPLGSLWHCWAA